MKALQARNLCGDFQLQAITNGVGYKRNIMMRIKSSYPNIATCDIEFFEQSFGVKLPSHYRNFLLKHNGGVPDDKFFLKNGADIVLNEFLPLNTGNLSIGGYLNDLNFNLQHLVPIAEDAFGNLILINCSNGNEAIYFWNHETELISWVANSFEYFVENLQGEVD